jgi:hypothetical protein
MMRRYLLEQSKWNPETSAILSESIQERAVVPAGCDQAMINRYSLEQSKWNPENVECWMVEDKLSLDHGGRH